MSEPTSRAEAVVRPISGVLHWTVHDDRIDFRSDAYAVETESGLVLIDPLPLGDKPLQSLETVVAICLTGGFHQRAAWSLRKRFDAPVYAPVGAQGLLDSPDASYDDSTSLPGALRALQKPGPTLPHYAFTWRTPAGDLALFCADLLIREGSGPLRFVSDEHHDDPAQTRESVRSLLELRADHLLPAHGSPEIGNAGEAIRRALELDQKG